MLLVFLFSICLFRFIFRRMKEVFFFCICRYYQKPEKTAGPDNQCVVYDAIFMIKKMMIKNLVQMVHRMVKFLKIDHQKNWMKKKLKILNRMPKKPFLKYPIVMKDPMMMMSIEM